MNLINKLPYNLYTAAQTRQLDSIAVSSQTSTSKLTSFKLMERAAKSIFVLTLEHYPQLKKNASLQIITGSGNNAGDGFLTAQLAKLSNINVSITLMKPINVLKGDALIAAKQCKELNITMHLWIDNPKIYGDVIIDALIGIGLNKDLSGNFATVIQQINHHNSPVVSIDIPSGVHPDTGNIQSYAILASSTITFIGVKQGLLTGMGPDHCGLLLFDDLKVPNSIYKHIHSNCNRLHKKQFSHLISPRKKSSHKGNFGHLLIIGGNHNFGGAIIMTAEAAIHCGVGKVSVITQPENIAPLLTRCPEVMAISSDKINNPATLLNQQTAIVIGPGLGTDQWAMKWMERVLSKKFTVLMDADALNLLAKQKELLKQWKGSLTITPHPLEAARLLNTDTKHIQSNRFNATSQLTDQYNACVVLKGAGTLIQQDRKISICNAGNPGMATSGMGDVLSGTIGAFLAQGMMPYDASCLGVWLHSTASDIFAQKYGEIGILASHVIPSIREQINHLHAL